MSTFVLARVGRNCREEEGGWTCCACVLLVLVFTTTRPIFPCSQLIDDELERGHPEMSRPVDMACRAVPFFYGVGFVVTFTSLFAKIERVLRLFEHAARGNYMRARVGIRELVT